MEGACGRECHLQPQSAASSHCCVGQHWTTTTCCDSPQHERAAARAARAFWRAVWRAARRWAKVVRPEHEFDSPAQDLEPAQDSRAPVQDGASTKTYFFTGLQPQASSGHAWALVSPPEDGLMSGVPPPMYKVNYSC